MDEPRHASSSQCDDSRSSKHILHATMLMERTTIDHDHEDGDNRDSNRYHDHGNQDMTNSVR